MTLSDLIETLYQPLALSLGAEAGALAVAWVVSVVAGEGWGEA